eukprot:2837313-Amphidinium_carterae.1
MQSFVAASCHDTVSCKSGRWTHTHMSVQRVTSKEIVSFKGFVSQTKDYNTNGMRDGFGPSAWSDQ